MRANEGMHPAAQNRAAGDAPAVRTTTMRKLYFDIDGTVLVLDTGVPKAAMANGGFEIAVRRAGFDEIICVGNFVAVIRTVWTMKPEYDGAGAIFALCGGAFQDEVWFRSSVRFVEDPKSRAAEIDLMADWWYVDDEAERYFTNVDRVDALHEHVGKRVCIPSSRGNGADILEWLKHSARNDAF